MRSSKLFAVLALVWMGLIWHLSSTPSRDIKITRTLYVMPHRAAHWATGKNAPLGVWGLVDRQDYTNIMDKPLHALEFGVLALLWWRSFSLARLPMIRMRAIWLSILISLAYACTDEYHQSFTPEREMSFNDLMADTAGIAVVVAACSWRRSKHRS